MEHSPLMKRAAELRNRIYELALQQPSDIKIFVSGQRLDGAEGEQRHWAPALAQTCKAIRAESIQLFYAINNFTFHEDREVVTHLQAIPAFKTCLGPMLVDALRSVNVVFCHVRPVPGVNYYSGRKQVDAWLELAAAEGASMPRCRVTVDVPMSIPPSRPPGSRQSRGPREEKYFKLDLSELDRAWERILVGPPFHRTLKGARERARGTWRRFEEHRRAQ